MFSDKLEWGHFLDDQQGRFNFGMIVQLSLCRGRRGCLGDQGRFNLVQSSLCRGASYYVHILCISLHRIERNLQGGTRGAGFVAGGLLRRRGAVCLHHQHHCHLLQCVDHIMMCDHQRHSHMSIMNIMNIHKILIIKNKQGGELIHHSVKLLRHRGGVGHHKQHNHHSHDDHHHDDHHHDHDDDDEN